METCSELTILFKTYKLIHCVLETEMKGRVYATFVYIANASQQRILLWEDLKALNNQVNEKWCLLGAFNEVKDIHEWWSGIEI